MMNLSNLREVKEKVNILVLLLIVFLAFITIYTYIPTIEYIEYDKNVTFVGRTFYIYKYVVEKQLFGRSMGHFIVEKYICPGKIENTTCIVTDRALVCENFSCLVYKGMIKG